MPQTETHDCKQRYYYWKWVQFGEKEEDLARQYL